MVEATGGPMERDWRATVERLREGMSYIAGVAADRTEPGVFTVECARRLVKIESVATAALAATDSLAALPGAPTTHRSNQGHGDTGSGPPATGHTAG